MLRYLFKIFKEHTFTFPIFKHEMHLKLNYWVALSYNMRNKLWGFWHLGVKNAYMLEFDGWRKREKGRQKINDRKIKINIRARNSLSEGKLFYTIFTHFFSVSFKCSIFVLSLKVPSEQRTPLPYLWIKFTTILNIT